MISKENLIGKMLDLLQNQILKNIDHDIELHEVIDKAYLSIKRRDFEDGTKENFICFNYNYFYHDKTYFILIILPKNPLKFLNDLNIELDKYKRIFKSHKDLIFKEKHESN